MTEVSSVVSKAVGQLNHEIKYYNINNEESPNKKQKISESSDELPSKASKEVPSKSFIY